MRKRKLVITGGRQKESKPWETRREEWHQYGEAVIASMDEDGQNARIEVAYKTPSNAIHDDDPAIVFKAGTVKDNKLYVSTNTEIIVYDLNNFEQESYLTHKYFNDVHHVFPWKGDYLIASTGLDMVFHMDKKGKIMNEWDTVPENMAKTWDRFLKDKDYRKVPTTKPHSTHPNYVFTYKNDIWVTRYEQQDCISVTNESKKIPIGLERTHDGKIYKDKAYFTTVDGHVVVVNMENLITEKVINLNDYNKKTETLGWCRGIEILNDHQILVGFSRIRPTKIKQNIQWIKGKLKKGNKYGRQKTRICLLDLEKNEFYDFFDLEQLQMNVVFSINLY